MSSKLRTLALLWMVLGPDKISMTTKLLELSSALDGFGPNGKKYNRNAGPQQFYGWFWALWTEGDQNCGPWQFYGWFWALENTCQQNCGPWQFYGWFRHSEEEAVKLSNIKGFIIMVGLWYHSWPSFGISWTTKHVEKNSCQIMTSKQ